MDAIKNDLLDFWFGPDRAQSSEVVRTRAELWWGRKPETDDALQARFGAAVTAAAGGVLDHWVGSPRGRLALILLLDQLPRAIYRGTPRAFANDDKALDVAAKGLVSGADRLLRPIERVFHYLPFEHSERLEDQERCVELMSALVEEAPEADRETFAGYLDYARRHREIIARFGRFPHRNVILGRESTPEELEFLKQPDSSF